MIKAQKFLTNVLCVSMVVSNITPVFAAVTNDTLAFEDTDTTALEQTEVLYEKAGSYFVTIPKIISLGIDKQSPYSVKVEGDIPSDRQVYVSPIDGIKDLDGFNFYMKDQSTTNPKADVVATVTQNKFYWNFSEVADGYAETSNQVTAEDLTSGTWKGTFDFEINMHKVEPERPDFTLTTDGDVTIPAGETHQLNAYIDGVESNSDVVWSCDNDEITINNGLIELPSNLEAGSELTITVAKDGKEVSFIVAVGEEDDAIEIKDWIYTLDDTNKTITLKQYTGSDTDVTVYNKYKSGDTIYKTKIAGNVIEYYIYSSDYMFSGKSNIQSITFEDNIDFSETSNMVNMFSGCESLTSLDVSNFDTSNVTNMERMFANCSSLTDLNLSNFDTSNVTDMNGMFDMCSSLISLDISNFDTSNVTDMNSMFWDCKSLISLDVSDFETSNVTNMERMFQNCTSLTNLDIIVFNTKNVINLYYMFSGCTSLTSLNLSSFDTNNVTSMDYMFSRCTNLKKIYVTNSKWSTSKATTTGMFSGCGTSSVTYE